MKNFIRSYELQIEKDGKIWVTSDLSISFTYEKRLRSSNDEFNCTIPGLKKETIDFITQEQCKVTMSCGYGSNHLLFKGSTVKAKENRGNGKTEVSLTCKGAVFEITTAFLNKSYAKGTPIKTIIQDALAAIGLPYRGLELLPLTNVILS